MRKSRKNYFFNYEAPPKTVLIPSIRNDIKVDRKKRGKRQIAELIPSFQTDRQTTSFIDNSIEAGILLGGNGPSFQTRKKKEKDNT
jgi:hypothetical protein